MIELLEKYPKAASVVRHYYLEQLLQSLKDQDLPQEFKEHVRQQEITNETIKGVISGNPRLLWDVFDENEIFISTFVDIFKTPIGFRAIIHDIKEVNEIPLSIYTKRKDMEQAAIERAFELLEQKL